VWNRHISIRRQARRADENKIPNGSDHVLNALLMATPRQRMSGLSSDKPDLAQGPPTKSNI